ncbi:MAG: dihydropteroate synthase [Promethearchaeota archaeon]
MNKIHVKLFDCLELGDDVPTVVMGVINLSPESFYKNSVLTNPEDLKNAINTMIKNGAKILDIGARSTAPWSEKITIKEEIARIIPALEITCEQVPKNILISIDTQFKDVAQKAYEIISNHERKMIINDVSCFKTDADLMNFILKTKIPTIIMASKNYPGDLLEMKDIIAEFKKILKKLKNKRYDTNKIILDPGIGHWVEKKIYTFDLKIINELPRLKRLKKPILVAISRKSFIGEILQLPDPRDRLNGTLSATAIAVYNGAHIIRTHDVNSQLFEIINVAEHLRRTK